MNFVADFIAAMDAAGCSPENSSVIIADGKWHDYQISGDPKGKKKGFFVLNNDGDFWSGRFGDRRQGGETVYWHSKSSRKFTEEEKKAWKLKRDQDRKRQEDETRKDHEETAARAKKIWGQAKPVITHPYLERKMVSGKGLRITSDGFLLIPMYADNKLWNLQSISETGEKLFLSRGRKKGCFYPLAETGDDKSVMALVEGYATGASTRQATGLPVLVAFDSGNLISVATDFRARYPDTRFIFPADNDQWTFNGKFKPKGLDPSTVPGDDPQWKYWRESGWLTNPGLIKAREAAAAIGGAAVICPDVPENDANKRTDYNDIFVTEGEETVKNRIMSVIAPGMIDPTGYFSPVGDSAQAGGDPLSDQDWQNWAAQLPPPESYSDEETRYNVSLYNPARSSKDPDWRGKLYYKDDKMVAKSLNNARLFIENDPILSNLFCYDEFAHEKIVYQCPPWQEQEKFKPRVMNDDDITNLTVELERRGILQPFGTVMKLVSAAIKNNAKNPAIEYFTRLEWDGVKRLDNWLAFYCGAESDDSRYVSMVGRKWLTAAVARVFEPGCKFDHMLILEGDQGSGKSQTLEQLATIHGKKYFDDTIRVSDLGNPNIVPKMQGVLIIEIAELSGFKKKDSSELKQAITTTQDRIIRKYENEATIYPRQFVFAGTLNPEGAGYFMDPTGNRRLWPVKVGSRIDIEALKRDKEQLWAEAVAAYRAGENLFLEEEYYAMAQTAQKARNSIHPWQGDIEKMIDKRDRISVDDVWSELGITDKTKRTRFAHDDLNKIMMGLGWEYTRRRFDGELRYCWIKKVDTGPVEDLEF